MKYTGGSKSRWDHLWICYLNEKEETEMLWSRDNVKRTIYDSPTRNRTGGRSRGGQRKQWVDKVEEWMGITFAK